jgi:hypothetical protein
MASGIGNTKFDAFKKAANSIFQPNFIPGISVSLKAR